jgi:hypothetical protein
MKIKVTKRDIENSAGYEESLEYCPIAFAVKRQMKTDCGIKVYGDDIQILTIGHPYRFYKLPKKAKDFIQKFDEGKEVKPFTFEAKQTQ